MSFKLFKSLNLVVFFLFLVSLGFSIKVMDLNGEEREYFSYNVPDIIIETSNISNEIILSYNLNNNVINESYNLTSCVLNSSNYCLELNIFDLIQKTNNSIQASLKYNIYFQNLTNYFYLDLIPPRFDFINYSINKSSRNITIYFNYSDDFNINKVGLYYINVSNNSSNFLSSLLNKSNFSFDILEENFKLKVEIKDNALNEVIKEKEYNIEDIFEPKILYYNFFESLNNNLKLNLSLEDNSVISKISLKYNEMEINLYPNQSNYINEIQLPKKENFKLLVFDNNSNVLEKNFEILSSFDFNRVKEYSNKKEFLINIFADSCKLILLNGDLESKNFVKINSNNFKLDLSEFDLNEGKINIKFICSLNNYTKEFESYFYYDITPPKNIELKVEKLNDGKIKLFWDKSEDETGEVKYYIFKNDEKITSTSRNGFYDSDVLYPEEYEYHLEIKDLAGNSIISNKVKEIPKKVKFNFKTNIEKNNIKVNNSKFNLILDLDENSIVDITLRNESGMIIYNDTILNSSSNIEILLNLNLGKNVLEIRGVDIVNNTKNFEYNIYYEEPKKILNLEEKDKNFENLSLIKNDMILESNFNESQFNKSELSELNFSKNISFYFWIFVLILLILLSSFYYSYLSKKDLISKRKKGEKDFMKSILYSSNSKKDIYLDKEVKRNKEKIIKKKEEKNKVKDKSESKKELSPFKKQILKDISKKEKINLEDILKKENKNIKIKNGFNKKKFNFINPFKIFKTKLEENKRKKDLELKKRQDPLNKYLEDKAYKTRNFWNSRKEYLLRTRLEKEEKKRKIEEEKLKEIQEKEKEKKDEERKKQLELDKKQREMDLKNKLKEEKKLAKDSLDDYLKEKSKKRKLFFAEREFNSLFRKK
jgi:hypothetical protein